MQKQQAAEYEYNRLYILYHLPSDYTQSDIHQALSQLLGGKQDPLASYYHFTPKMVTENRVVLIRNPRLLEILNKGLTSLEIRARPVKIAPYFGEQTEREIETRLARLTVYVAGIPVKASPSEIYTVLNSKSEILDFYTPRSGKNNNRHFGFAVCTSEDEKEKLLALRTIKTDRFKLLIRHFDFENYLSNVLQHRDNREQLRGRTLHFHKKKIVSNLFSGNPALFLLGEEPADKTTKFNKQLPQQANNKQAVTVDIDEDSLSKDLMHKRKNKKSKPSGMSETHLMMMSFSEENNFQRKLQIVKRNSSTSKPTLSTKKNFNSESNVHFRPIN